MEALPIKAVTVGVCRDIALFPPSRNCDCHLANIWTMHVYRVICFALYFLFFYFTVVVTV